MAAGQRVRQVGNIEELATIPRGFLTLFVGPRNAEFDEVDVRVYVLDVNKGPVHMCPLLAGCSIPVRPEGEPPRTDVFAFDRLVPFGCKSGEYERRPSPMTKLRSL